MTDALWSLSAAPQVHPHRTAKAVVAVVLALWFALVFVLGWAEAFVAPPGQPPVRNLAGALLPVVVFGAAYWTSRAFRDLVLSADLRLITAIQAWRFAGFGFLALYAHGVLPSRFALPAGFGDIAIAVTAPLIVMALIRRPAFAASRTFVAWNVLGILDLMSAVGSGALAVILAARVPGAVVTVPMAQLPLVLLPAYLVPIFVMLHIAALVQARRLRSRSTTQA
jgi:hypothetical protein